MSTQITFFTGFFEHLSQHVALLDKEGCIVYTNKKWRDFAHENGGYDNIGDDYLHYSPPDVRQGIEQVLGGHSDFWQTEYPCHSPQQRRFFVMQVTRSEVEGQVFVLVTHENVSVQRMAQVEMVTQNAAISAQGDLLAQYAFATTHALQEPLRHLMVTSSAMAAEKTLLSVERLSRYAQINHDAAERISTMLHSLGQYATLSREHVHLPDFFDLQLAFEQAAQEANLTLAPSNQPLPAALLDPKQGILMIRNLVQNFAQYHVSGEVVEITAQRQGTFLHLYLRLAQLEEGQIKDALQLFQRKGHAALGFSQQMAQQYGGRVWMEGEGGRMGLHLTVPLWSPAVNPRNQESQNRGEAGSDNQL